jgi:uncharacterized delta-60 repeat protein
VSARPITAVLAVSVLVSSVLVATGPLALAAAGDLDTTFGAGGLVTTDFGTDPHVGGYAYAIAVQLDGKIVAAGFAGSSFGLTRFNPDGTLDAAFDGDGKVTTGFGRGSAGIFALTVQPDGRIVAVGHQGRGKFAIARYGTDGALDTTFSGNGKAATDFSPRRLDGATDVALQADGQILAAGVAGVRPGPGGGKFALVRYNSDGTLDTNFGDEGKATTDFTPRADVPRQVAIQDDGTIVLAGTARGGREFAMARYNPDGTLDTTFSGDGKAVAAFTPGGSIYTVAIQADGKIVAAGSTDDESAFALARYNTDGTADTTFGEVGGTTTDVTTGHDGVSAVAMQADGKIVAAGDGTSSVFALARYNTDGSLDTTFSGDGITTTDFSPYYDVAYAVAIQGDGKIVAAGAANGSVFALARYLAS